MHRATVDLPEPLSPTSATVSPALTCEVDAVDGGEDGARPALATGNCLTRPETREGGLPAVTGCGS